MAALRLSRVSGVGPGIWQRLAEQIGSPQAVLDCDPAHLCEVPGIGQTLARKIADARNSDEAVELFELCRQHEFGFVVRGESTYPELLSEIPDPPNVLFCSGELLPSDSLSIAVVGSRHGTNYGRQQAESLGRSLALAGFTVVSGLARGIDAAAHLGALQAGGRTVAVLGSGLLNLYPPEHEGLAKEIAAQGAVVSEYHPQQAPKSGAFPQRNRIVTGLCLGVIIVEAPERSGALISARLAMEQNREVFAVPGPVTSRMSRGCHRLIRDGARLVETIDDVIEELGPLAAPAKISNDSTVRHPAELKLTGQETKVLNLIDVEPTQIDLIIQKSGLPAQRVLSTVSVLEMRKLIRRTSGTTVSRI